MAEIVFASSFNMLNPPTWVGQTHYSALRVPSGGEFWMIEEGRLAPGTYRKSNLEGVIEAGANALIYTTDIFTGDARNITSLRIYARNQDPLPGENLFPPQAYINDFSFSEIEFLSYFQTGQTAQFFEGIMGGTDLVFGSGGGDFILGYGGNDIVRGMGGSDTIWGGEGSDTLSGGEANDFLVGFSGIDYARYDEVSDRVTSDNYSIIRSQVNDSWIVRQDSGQSFKSEGLDTLSGIERLIFADKNVALDIDGTSAVAYRLYKAAFDRAPDLTGLGFWIASMDSGVTGLEVAQGFINSPEFLGMYGADSSNADFVDRLYLNILDRPGETEGRNYWINALDNGAARQAILLDFSESPENQANVAQLISNGIDYIPFVFA